MDGETYLREFKNYSDDAISRWKKEGPEVQIFRGTVVDLVSSIITDNLPAPDDEEGFNLRPYIDEYRLARDLVGKYKVQLAKRGDEVFVVQNAGCF